MTDEQIALWCDEHGAKAVSDAAYRRMHGDRAALPALGIADAANLGEAYRITCIAFRLMEPDERAAELADAAIGVARIATRPGIPPTDD